MEAIRIDVHLSDIYNGHNHHHNDFEQMLQHYCQATLYLITIILDYECYH